MLYVVSSKNFLQAGPKTTYQGWRKRGSGQTLADQSTLSQPARADYAHHVTTGCLTLKWVK